MYKIKTFNKLVDLGKYSILVYELKIYIIKK